ncbi:hypothetical protein [uncultured Sphingomonas sp.]|uniref:hypothetical protein n=1 Tax=uncultured Sphingomonas sp. TaxID=158754 RepID=UPI002638AFB9|nr:hypothetical protein [uncultured Sphingomonas sp.]
MRKLNDHITQMSAGGRAAVAVALLAIGAAAGGTGGAAFSHPEIRMAPTTVTPIARLAGSQGIVRIKGRITEVYGDRFVMADGTGRAMIDAGRPDRLPAAGQTISVQGRFDDGQFRAAYLVSADGMVEQVGPRPGHGRPKHGPGPRHDAARDEAPGDRDAPIPVPPPAG